ncbi:hypothetical protein UCRPC4_g00586 [Phaeomoniella chlamydospora]|uniref:Uncharacterized protein n=1 Tax=Phaeomoniella chlamydospora TaxID=158046 RepID=A0A0G2F282_PHACM|nr:hypothetical protein UCRPC4_g00586 [Phaeomoniella chlamydospora]
MPNCGTKLDSSSTCKAGSSGTVSESSSIPAETAVGSPWIPRQSSSIPTHLSFPDSYRIPGQFLSLIGVIQAEVIHPLILPNAAFEGTQDEEAEDFKAIVRRRKAINPTPMTNLFKLVMVGVDLLEQGSIKSGFASLEAAFREIRPALMEPSPGNIANLLFCILYALDKNQIHVAEMIARYVYLQSNSIFGLTHPFTLWSRLLTQNGTWCSKSILHVAKVADTDATTMHFGPLDSWSIAKRQGLIQWNIGMENLSFTQINACHESLLRTCSLSRRVNVRTYIDCRRAYGWHLDENGHYQAAEEVLSDTPRQMYENYAHRDDTITAITAVVEDVVKYIAKQGEYSRANTLLEEALDRARAFLSGDDPVMIHLLKTAVLFQREHGTADAARAVEEDLNKSLERFQLEEQ